MPCIVNKSMNKCLAKMFMPDTFALCKTKGPKTMMSRKMNNSNKEEWNRSFRNLRVVGVREWVSVMLLMLIPVLNIVMLCRWASADVETIPASKVYWARATLLVFGAVLLATVLLFAFFFLGAMVHI